MRTGESSAVGTGESLAVMGWIGDGHGPTRTGDPLGVNEVLWPAELGGPLEIPKASGPASSGETVRMRIAHGRVPRSQGGALRIHGRAPRVVLAIAGGCLAALVLAQLVLPSLPARRVRRPLGREGAVKSGR